MICGLLCGWVCLFGAFWFAVCRLPCCNFGFSVVGFVFDCLVWAVFGGCWLILGGDFLVVYLGFEGLVGVFGLGLVGDCFCLLSLVCGY